MNAIRPAKKNGSIEIRLPDETKAAFMKRCHLEGLTASQAVRTFIDDRLASGSTRGKCGVSALRACLVGLAGALVGAGFAAPSMARSAERSEAAFHALDQNRDGSLTYEEFRAP